MKTTALAAVILATSAFHSLGQGTGYGTGYDGDAHSPHESHKAEVKDSTVTLRISGVLQPNDAQFAHDIVRLDSGKKIGTVRMRWGYKYGHRYGLGVVLEGKLEETWKGGVDEGWITVRLTQDRDCKEVVILSRLQKIPD